MAGTNIEHVGFGVSSENFGMQKTVSSVQETDFTLPLGSSIEGHLDSGWDI